MKPVLSRADAVHDGFLRVAASTPSMRVGDVAANAAAICEDVRRAASLGASVLVTPELSLTGYTCADLFHDRALLASAREALEWLARETCDVPVAFCVGLPWAEGSAVYNCVATVCAGTVWGLTAKENLPNYREFYEARWFAPAPAEQTTVRFMGRDVPFGARLVFCCEDEHMRDVHFGVEVCEDLWVPEPPSVKMALAGATLVLNASASDEVVGKSAYRKGLVSGQSARLYCAYAYASAGCGESTTDLVFAGEDLIAQNGSMVAATKPFSRDVAVADVDLERLAIERQRSTTWGPVRGERLGVLEVPFSFGPSSKAVATRAPGRYRADETLAAEPCMPFVPAASDGLDERCELILDLQAQGLATRLAHTGTTSVVVGLSGGLDSTLALLVCARAFDALGLDRAGVHAVSMPGFGTTSRTKGNAELLAEELGVDFRTIPIADAVMGHFADIGHDPSVHDVTYENGQARERTQILMDLSNRLGGFVIGTGDLSELALGWATYNADHMSMYGVNASVPKTLVRYLVGHVARGMRGRGEDGAARVLEDILDTPVSPELLPPTGDGQIAQKTEDLVGPYELHDFFLYQVLRFGFEPEKVFRMALRSFGESYDPATIMKWLRTFYRRFFAQQFKRSCLPDGPKVGSVTLSPRGDWRMPSDASSALWLERLDALACRLGLAE